MVARHFSTRYATKEGQTYFCRCISCATQLLKTPSHRERRPNSETSGSTRLLLYPLLHRSLSLTPTPLHTGVSASYFCQTGYQRTSEGRYSTSPRYQPSDPRRALFVMMHPLFALKSSCPPKCRGCFKINPGFGNARRFGPSPARLPFLLLLRRIAAC